MPQAEACYGPSLTGPRFNRDYSFISFVFFAMNVHGDLRDKGRIQRIIKLDQDVQSVTKEAAALIGKSMVRL